MYRITISQTSTSHFQPLFRRLSRIFSHAYYSHRELFQLAEVETSLYARFVALCEKYELVTPNLLVIPRSVVAESLDGAAPEEENEDEDEEEDEDSEEEERSRSRDKGEGGRRPHSLDRHARPHKLEDLRGTVKGWPQGGERDADAGKDTAPTGTEPTNASPPSESSEGSSDVIEEERQKASEATIEEADPPAPSTAPESIPPTESTLQPDPISLNTTQTYSLKPRTKKDKPSSKIPLPPHGTGTLGRGKKGRGTMLWSSDTPSTSETTTTPTVESEADPLQRTESIETAILAPEDLEGEGPVPPVIAPEPKEEDVKEEEVPKDEIELLEEEGVLEPLPTSSPIPASVDITKPDSDIPSNAPGDVDNAGKLEKVDEIEKGIENLDEIKDEEKVIQPAVVDLLESTPVLDTSESKDLAVSSFDSDSTEPITEPEPSSKEETSTTPAETESRLDGPDTNAKEDVSSSKELAKDSTTTKDSSTKKDSTKKD